MPDTLSFAYSPCPNDTFMFGAIALHAISAASFDCTVKLHDVQTLNEQLVKSVHDISKASFYAFLRAQDTYALLDAGAALGYGCGPIVVAQSADALRKPETATVAVPGELTTATLLLRLWLPELTTSVAMPYDRIMEAVRTGAADAGVIIHESRFSYTNAGLVTIRDLGDWWEEETSLPVPLGGIFAKRSLEPGTHRDISELIRNSIAYARKNMAAVSDYVSCHAQEISPEVQRRHIDTFVNEFSIDIGDVGRAAINRLAEMARERAPFS